MHIPKTLWFGLVALLATVSTTLAQSVTVEQLGMVAPGLRGYQITADSGGAAEVNSFQFNVTGNPHQVWDANIGPATVFTDDQGPGFLAAWEAWDTRVLAPLSDLISIPGFPITSETNDGTNPAGLTLTGHAGVGDLSVDGMSYTPSTASSNTTFLQVIVPVGNTVDVDGSFITEVSPGVLQSVTINETLSGIALLEGDTDADGTVGPADLTTLKLNWLSSGKAWPDGDFNFDGSVGPADLTAMKLNWLASGPSAPQPESIPEPATAVLAVLGAGAFLRRNPLQKRRQRPF